jgi:hypothetical protein
MQTFGRRPATVRFICSCIAVMSCIMLVAFAASAQKPGKLAGKISDAGNNEPLSGVSITTKSSKQGIASITDGSYALTLPAGTYTIRYSNTGYKTKEITDVVIRQGETTILDIVLESAPRELTDVVVTASVKREAQSSVYSLQRRSAAASDGISIEAINRTPDNNSGQVLRRVTGVNVSENKFVVIRGLSEQYNQTLLNGVPMTSTESNKNAFAFDLIPAAAIDNIVVNKTATPDMPGNFAGGIVQINTKDFPAKSFFSVSVQGGASDQTYGKTFFSDQRGRFQWLGFDGGIRNLPGNFPTNTSRVPFIFQHPIEQVRYYSALPNNLLPVNQGAAGLNEQVQIGFGKNFDFSDKTQLGIVASLNQRKTTVIEEDINIRNPNAVEEFYLFPEVRQFYVDPPIPSNPEAAIVRNYSRNTRYRYAVDLGGVLNIAYRFRTNKITLKNLFTQVYSNQFVDRPYIFIADGLAGIGDPAATYQQFGYVYNNSLKRILNSTLGGEHRTGVNNETRLDWNVTTTFNQQSSPDKRSFVFGSDSAKKLVAINNNIFQLPLFISTASRIWDKLNDFIVTTGFNVTTPFKIRESKHLFKTGFLVQNRYRENRVSIIAFGDLRGDPSNVLSAESLLRGTSRISSNSALVTRGGDYNAGSSLVAVYESIENKFGDKWRVIWGGRLEKYQQNANLFNAVYYDGFVRYEPVVNYFSSRTEFNFLPSVNVIYSPTQKINVRGAFSRTVLRPDLKDIIDFPSFDVANLRITQGNPELTGTRITNFDLKFEWFPAAGEILSAAVFHKNIADPIEYVVPVDVANYPQVSGVPVNTGKAFVRGIELEVRKKLDFIGILPWLKNVSLSANSTILESKVFGRTLPSTIAPVVIEHRLTGQPNLIINAGVNISALKNTLELSFTFNRSSDYIGELGSFDPLPIVGNVNFPGVNYVRQQRVPNFYVRRRNMLDIVISKSFMRNKAKVKLNIGNVFREPFILYQDLNRNNRFDKPLTVLGGPYFKNGTQDIPTPGLYVSGVDNTATRLTGQRLYEFTVSYTF